MVLLVGERPGQALPILRARPSCSPCSGAPHGPMGESRPQWKMACETAAQPLRLSTQPGGASCHQSRLYVICFFKCCLRT